MESPAGTLEGTPPSLSCKDMVATNFPKEESFRKCGVKKPHCWGLALSLAIKTLVRVPTAHVKVRGFNSQFRLLTPASCSCAPWEAAG